MKKNIIKVKFSFKQYGHSPKQRPKYGRSQICENLENQQVSLKTKKQKYFSFISAKNLTKYLESIKIGDIGMSGWIKHNNRRSISCHELIGHFEYWRMPVTTWRKSQRKPRVIIELNFSFTSGIFSIAGLDTRCVFWGNY